MQPLMQMLGGVGGFVFLPGEVFLLCTKLHFLQPFLYKGYLSGGSFSSLQLRLLLSNKSSFDFDIQHA